MRCDQTTRPIRKQKASLERWYPYLSCFTLGFEIYAHQLGHNGSGKIMVPCGQRQKVSDMSISSNLSMIFFTKRLQKKIELVGRPDDGVVALLTGLLDALELGQAIPHVTLSVLHVLQIFSSLKTKKRKLLESKHNVI